MKLLHIDSSILGENSVSRSLTVSLVERQKALHPGLEVTYLDLSAQPPMHLSGAHIGALFGHPPTDAATIADIAATSSYIDDLLAADIIVIGAPMYNFTLPSQLKAWIDRVLVAGKTFKYGEGGVPVGLVPPGKQVFIASTRGGAYVEGSPASFLDHQETYLKGALAFIGLTDVTIIRAETVAVPDLKPAAIAGAQAQIAALTV
ncbi:MAG: FMN-dependent NADH-azoreductase [Acidocella sp. 20-61-6]|nr:MAG: FMN-dependent NADH-azoreductase [Acidocella sp. 20-61-6]